MTKRSDESPPAQEPKAPAAPGRILDPRDRVGYFEHPSRREMIKRVGAAAGVLAGSAALGRLVWDKGGFSQGTSEGVRQVRDYTLKGTGDGTELAELAIARAPKNLDVDPNVIVDPAVLAEDLVRRAVDAMGGMKRFISRGDVVVIKPNIGWDRMPIHAANTNPDDLI